MPKVSKPWWCRACNGATWRLLAQRLRWGVERGPRQDCLACGMPWPNAWHVQISFVPAITLLDDASNSSHLASPHENGTLENADGNPAVRRRGRAVAVRNTAYLGPVPLPHRAQSSMRSSALRVRSRRRLSSTRPCNRKNARPCAKRRLPEASLWCSMSAPMCT